MSLKYFKRFFIGMFNKGGVLAMGLGCLYLHRIQYIPASFGPVPYGIITLGAIGIGRYIIMNFKITDKPGKTKDQEPRDEHEGIPEKLHLEILEQRKNEILKNLQQKMSEKLRQRDDEERREGRSETLSEEELQELQTEMQIKPEERDILEKYFKGFEECLRKGNHREDGLEQFEDVEIEMIDREDCEMLSEVM